MRTILQICFVVVMFWSLSADARTRSLDGAKTNVCTVLNGSSHALGNVILLDVDDSVVVLVPGSGTYFADVAAIVTEIEINGQIVHVNESGPVTLANGKSVSIIWPAINEVEIIDCDENTILNC